MSGVPPRVTPTALTAPEPGNLFSSEQAKVTNAWTLLNGALGYWLPHGLNQGIGGAQAAAAKRRRG